MTDEKLKKIKKVDHDKKLLWIAINDIESMIENSNYPETLGLCIIDEDRQIDRGVFRKGDKPEIIKYVVEESLKFYKAKLKKLEEEFERM